MRRKSSRRYYRSALETVEDDGLGMDGFSFDGVYGFWNDSSPSISALCLVTL